MSWATRGLGLTGGLARELGMLLPRTVAGLTESTGWVREADIEQNLSGSMRLRPANAPPETVPTTVRARTRMQTRE